MTTFKFAESVTVMGISVLGFVVYRRNVLLLTVVGLSGLLYSICGVTLVSTVELVAGETVTIASALVSKVAPVVKVLLAAGTAASAVSFTPVTLIE